MAHINNYSRKWKEISDSWFECKSQNPEDCQFLIPSVSLAYKQNTNASMMSDDFIIRAAMKNKPDSGIVIRRAQSDEEARKAGVVFHPDGVNLEAESAKPGWRLSRLSFGDQEPNLALQKVSILEKDQEYEITEYMHTRGLGKALPEVEEMNMSVSLCDSAEAMKADGDIVVTVYHELDKDKKTAGMECFIYSIPHKHSHVHKEGREDL